MQARRVSEVKRLACCPITRLGGRGRGEDLVERLFRRLVSWTPIESYSPLQVENLSDAGMVSVGAVGTKQRENTIPRKMQHLRVDGLRWLAV